VCVEQISMWELGTKAWLHFYSMNLRTQLEKSGSKVRVIEIIPPMVETELHHMRHDPKDNAAAKGGMTVDEFMKDVLEGWESNADEVAAGMAKRSVGAWRDTFGGMYEKNAH
jgi:short-subunit dehydrogenase involved in D-alanine esterification of teichoic acids